MPNSKGCRFQISLEGALETALDHRKTDDQNTETTAQEGETVVILRSQIESHKSLLSQLQNQLKEKDDLFRNQIDNKDANINQLMKRLEEKDTQIERLHQIGCDGAKQFRAT